jgi:large subunit ribosomal protein L23
MKDLHLIILGMQVTEKGTALTEKQNKYLFKVAPTANKIEIKRAVEQLYKVSVKSVNTQQYEGKLKRNRRFQQGQRSDWKRAIVTLKEGSKIELA